MSSWLYLYPILILNVSLNCRYGCDLFQTLFYDCQNKQYQEGNLAVMVIRQNNQFQVHASSDFEDTSHFYEFLNITKQSCISMLCFMQDGECLNTNL